jgi:hypothetical protein
MSAEIRLMALDRCESAEMRPCSALIGRMPTTRRDVAARGQVRGQGARRYRPTRPHPDRAHRGHRLTRQPSSSGRVGELTRSEACERAAAPRRSGFSISSTIHSRKLRRGLSSALRCTIEGRQGVSGGALGHFLGPPTGRRHADLDSARSTHHDHRQARQPSGGGHLMNVQSSPERCRDLRLDFGDRGGGVLMSYRARRSCAGVGVVREGGSRQAGSFTERGVELNRLLAAVVAGTTSESLAMGMAWP